MHIIPMKAVQSMPPEALRLDGLLLADWVLKTMRSASAHRTQVDDEVCLIPRASIDMLQSPIRLNDFDKQTTILVS